MPFINIPSALTPGDDTLTGVKSFPDHPAFHANKGASDQVIADGTATKLTFSTEELDQSSAFAASRFTPAKTGVYLISGSVKITGVGALTTAFSLMLYKNGAAHKQIARVESLSGLDDLILNGAVPVGVTSVSDYFELFMQFVGSTGNSTVSGVIADTYFAGVKVA